MEEQQKKHRRKYDKQFKEDAIRLITDGRQRTSEVARNLGIGENILYRWKNQLIDEGKHAFPGKGNLKPEDAELRQLKTKLRDVTEERDILKKALAYFSRSER